MLRLKIGAAFIGLLAGGLCSGQISADLVISQVYGGGGNSGAPYTHDFVEIFNRGTSAVSLAGKSIQYGSATGTGNLGGTTTQITELPNVTLQPGQYFLVQEASNAAVGAALPTPDATDASPIAMAGAAGKVALVNSTTGLGCNGGSTPCSAAQQALIIDLVGYGGANFFEGAGPTPVLSNTTAALRAGGGCTDTGNNSADFTVVAPAPRNSASALNSCGGPAPLTITTSTPLPAATVGTTYTVTFQASGGTGTGYVFSAPGGTPNGLNLVGATLSGSPTQAASPASFTIGVVDSGNNTASKQFQLTINPAAPVGCAPTHTISQIQGSGIVSPITGATVTTHGVVTALVSSGFFLQGVEVADKDADPATSDGIFVFTNSAPTVSLKNIACVTGTVSEFGRSGSPRTVTELVSPVVTVEGTAASLPDAVLFTGATTNPAGTVDQYERYEGMRVSLAPLLVTGATSASVTESSNTSTSNGRFYGVLTGAQTVREPGIPATDALALANPSIPRFDGNPEVLSIESATQTGATLLNPDSTATVTGITGVLHYDFAEWKVYPDPLPVPVVSGGKLVTPVPAPGSSQATVGSLNLERFYNTTNDPGGDVVLTDAAFQGRLTKASKLIREVMLSPDIVAVSEVENLSTLQTLADKLNADSLPATPGYTAYLAEGNDLGGIDVGFLVKGSRVAVNSVTQQGLNEPLAGYTGQLLNDRPPLVLKATVQKAGTVSGLGLTVIAVHQLSMSNVDLDDSTGVRAREKRRQQTVFLANLIQSMQTANPNERIVVAGDFNAFPFSDGYVDVLGGIMGSPTTDPVLVTVADLVNPNLTNPITARPLNEQYSYNFVGNNQTLDHILVNQAGMARLSGYAHGRVNADFAESNRGDVTTAKRLSDHDPAVAYFTLPEAVDVTGQTQVTRGGLVFNRLLNAFTQTVAVKNVGAQALNGPVSVAATALPAGVALANASGTMNDGTPYLVMTAGALAPGASVTQTFRFTRTGTQTITWTPKVTAGAY